MADGSSNALATRSTVTDLVRTYEECERDIRSSFAKIRDAQERLALAFGGYEPQIRAGLREPALDFGEPDRAIVAIRRQCWEQLVARLELRKVMSIKRYEEFWKQVSNGPDKDVPDLTVELVLGLFANLTSQLDDMLRECVAEVYEWLRPHRSEYKSNSEFGVGKRVVLTYMVERHSWGWAIDWQRSQYLTALERVMRMLDGRSPISSDGNHYSDIETAIRGIPASEDCKGETLYFKFRGFQNRNLHLEFTRPDLLAHLNKVAGGGMLPQKAGEKRRGPSAADVLADAVERARRNGFGDAGLDYFDTPLALGEELVGKLDLFPGALVFEPSAGTGALVRAIVLAQPEVTIDAWELDHERSVALCRRELAAGIRNGGLNPVHGDFLLKDPPSGEFATFFDRVAMNSPFSHQRDILHVSHALRFLKPGGVLVAIMSAGCMFRGDKLSRAFRQLLAENQGEVWNNRADAFKASGTMVRTVMVRMRRGAA